jgi:hypothetical protein
MGDTSIPEPERHWFYLRCPACHTRIWNQMFTTDLTYKIHYRGHIIEDLITAVDTLAKGGDPRCLPQDRYLTRWRP